MPTILSVLFYIINYQPHLGNPNSKFSIFHHMQHRLTCLYNGNLSNQVPASKSILNQNVHRSVIRTASTEPKKEKKLTGPFKSLSFETSHILMRVYLTMSFFRSMVLNKTIHFRQHASHSFLTTPQQRMRQS